MISISLCMIVKNEEDVLQRILSCAKRFCDEIIIVDTGSTDTTMDIARKYTDKIYEFEWVDSFAKARNFSFSKATKDYIGPVAPLIPSAPVGPVTPIGPVAPATPSAPVGPMAPVGPVAPTIPSAPVGPVAPVGPIKPSIPPAPVGPGDVKGSIHVHLYLQLQWNSGR